MPIAAAQPNERTTASSVTSDDHDIKRLTDSMNLRYAELPTDIQSKIAASRPTDWTATRFPERDELYKLRDEVGTLDGVRRTVKGADAG